jgi:simple sugar transport system permease protein
MTNPSQAASGAGTELQDGKSVTEFYDARAAGRDGPLAAFAKRNRLWLGTLMFLVILLVVFTIASPAVFLSTRIYYSIGVTVPVAMVLVMPAVFLVTAGEIDLSFPSVMGLCGFFFAGSVAAGIDPLLAIAIAISGGVIVGFLVGVLVVYGKLSSLVATLGVNFILRGAMFVATDGNSIALLELRGSAVRNAFAGDVFGVPAQLLWALGFALICFVLYRWHRFGIHVHHIGDNPESARAMGINVDWTRCLLFAFMGLGAALAGIISILTNYTWWPTSGDGLLLVVLAALFVGGTPTWGGVGTIFGAVLGAIIVTLMDVGVVAAGLSGFYTQLISGVIIVIALLGHRMQAARVR